MGFEFWVLGRGFLNPKPETRNPKLFLFEPQAHSIDAVPQTGRWWTIIEYMSQVSFASSTLYFCPSHAQCVVSRINNALLRNGLKKTWPTTSAVKFGIAFKKGIAACHTVVGANFC